MNDVTWGLDVSTSKAKTAAVALDWSSPGRAHIVEVVHPLPAAKLPPLIAAHAESTWAVDVPFGWPDLFVDLLSIRHDGPLTAHAVPRPEQWETWRTRDVAKRRTDRFVTDDPRINAKPLRVPFQLLGATAAMWVLVEAELVELGVTIDRAGLHGSVCETYPAAALAAWGYGLKKRAWPELQRIFDFLTVPSEFEDKLTSDDVCDAVVCALIARARDRRLTIEPPAADVSSARREGWIHVTCEPPSALLTS